MAVLIAVCGVVGNGRSKRAPHNSYGYVNKSIRTAEANVFYDIGY